MATVLRFPAKAIRARVIDEYVQAAGYRGCVCFSSGNASAALRGRGLYVVDVSPNGKLEATQWWQPEEIRKAWPDLFDATAGHLPAYLMVRLAKAYREHLGVPLSIEPPYYVPTGSGETLMCLRWAYPGVVFYPYRDGTIATRRHMQAPLLGVAGALADDAQALQVEGIFNVPDEAWARQVADKGDTVFLEAEVREGKMS